jgi:quercetin dioxygenase-like cupin family protein
MSHVQLDQIEYLNAWFEGDSGPQWRVQFPFQGESVSESFGSVAIELDPGEMLPIHMDSQDELVIVLAGTIEAVAGDIDTIIHSSGMLFIPATEPHGFRNIGESVARMVGVFTHPAVISTFGKPVMPLGQRILGAVPVDQLSGIVR